VLGTGSPGLTLKRSEEEEELYFNVINDFYMFDEDLQ
jgi:hypothetical protein